MSGWIADIDTYDWPSIYLVSAANGSSSSHMVSKAVQFSVLNSSYLRFCLLNSSWFAITIVSGSFS